MMKALKLLMLSFTLIWAQAGNTAPQVLRFGVDPTFPPFESKTQDGTLVGFDIDLGNAICAQAKITCVWVQTNFDGAIPGLKARKFDAILSAMSITDKRKEQINFSNVVYKTPSALVSGKISGINAGLNSLRGKNVGVAQGTVQETYAKSRWEPAGITVISYNSQMEIYPDLIAGRLDATLINAVSAEMSFLKTPEGNGFEIKTTFNDSAISGNGVGIGLRKEDSQLEGVINTALSELHKNGTYDSLSKKYFNFDIYPEDIKNDRSDNKN
ncbi:transporter substrate-binding domain-containing protein [Pantoea endophytica]